jgi:RHS repeat-associated protein
LFAGSTESDAFVCCTFVTFTSYKEPILEFLMSSNASAHARFPVLWVNLAMMCLMQAANASEPQLPDPSASDTFFLSSFENGETLPCQAAQDTDHDGLLDPVCIEVFVPPDPVSVAPPIDQTVISDFWTINQFLIRPPNAIQREAVSGAIKPYRAAVMRGWVRDEVGMPLPDVLVRVLNHPEYGYTYSRADGGYDMLVNGGGDVVLDFQKTGYMRAQRSAPTVWKDWKVLEDIHLVPFDAASTQVFFGSGSGQQVHRATTVTDGDGTRTSTLIIPAGTEASLRRLDGSVVIAPSLRLRATEYTVGEYGPKRMPATLPETSGYTYAVELSADEAVMAGARTIEFDQPVSLYLENYLQMPIGEIIPVGYYDHVYGSWLPEDNGRVIRVLDIAGGVATLDVDGSGLPANSAALAALGIDMAERTRLASIYSAGQELWRTPLSHFTSIDLNWPYVPVEPSPEPPSDPNLDDNPPTPPDENPGTDQEANPPISPDNNPDDSDKDEEDPTCEKGSVIECENARLREYIPIAGTPLSLAYQSARMPGGSFSTMRARVKLTPDTVPPTVRYITADIMVGGNIYLSIINPPLPNQSFDFTYDGSDPYGRSLQGTARFTVTISYIYDPIYTPAIPRDLLVQAWAGLTGVESTGARAWGNRSYKRSRTWSSPGTVVADAQYRRRGVWDARGLQNGGWSFSEHHVYDPERRIVLKGDGSMRSADVPASTDIALTFPYAPERDGQVVGPDASVWRVWRGSHGGVRGPEAALRTTISRALPGGPLELLVESCPADPLNINFCAPGFTPTFDVNENEFVYVADEVGDFYFAGGRSLFKLETATRTVRLVRDSGASNEPCVYKHLRIHERRMYYSCQEGSIGMVWPNGSATTLARGGIEEGDNIPVLGANLFNPQSIDVDAHGNVLYVESAQPRLRRLGVDGRIRTIAGNGAIGVPVDGAIAANSPLPFVGSVQASDDGSYYILAGARVFQVQSNGQIYTVLGGGNEDLDPTRVQRARSLSISPDGFVRSMPDGSLIYGKSYREPAALIRIGGGSFRFDGEGGQHIVPSEDGSRYWVFDERGRHLETRSAATGGLLLKFHYNNAGLLTGVEDGDGDFTEIERGTNGRASAIESPDGHRTTLSYDAADLLEQVDSVENRSWKLAYDPSPSKFGLLTRFEDPRENASIMEWSDAGRLTKDTDAEGGYTQLFRSLWNNLDAEKTILQTAEGRQRYVWSNNSPGRVFRHASLFTGGLEQSSQSSTHADFRVHRDNSVSAVTRVADDRFGFSVPIVSSTRSLQQPILSTEISRSQVSLPTILGAGLGQRDLQYQTLTNGRQYLRNYDAISRTWATRSPMLREMSLSVDEQERPLQLSVPGFNPVNYQYDTRGRLQTITSGTGPDQRQWQFGYDSKGYLGTLTDPLLRTTTLINDNAGRTTTQILPDTRQVGFGYDQNGNVIRVTPPGRADHVFVFNKVNRVKEYQPPVIAGVPDVTTDYAYNLDRIISGQTRQGTQQITPTLDPGSGLAVALTTPNGSYTFIRETNTGRVQHDIAPGDVQTYREFNGPLMRIEQTYLDGYDGLAWSGAINYLYDANHWLDQLIIATQNPANGQLQQVVDYNYDADGLLTQAIVDSNSNLILMRDTQNGLLNGTQMGQIVDAWQYNGFAESVDYHAQFNSDNLLHVVYTRDKRGRITEKVETVGSTTTTTAYGYDTTGRLDTVTENGVLIADYGYDSNSNRTSAVLASTGIAAEGCAAGMTNVSGAIDAQDRLLSYGNCTYTYTANGELTSRLNTSTSQSTMYNYDVFANLRGATLPNGDVLSYQVDGRNRRIGKLVNGVKVQGFLYVNQLEPVAETDGAGNRIATFIYADRSNVPSYLLKGGNTYRVVSDHLGSVRLVVDVQDGSIVQRMDYDAWGNVLVDTNPGFQPFGFAGGIYDRDLRLVRFGARDYDPESGRWTAKDPIRFQSGLGPFYAYVDSDPINFLDNTGKIKIEVGNAAAQAAIKKVQEIARDGSGEVQLTDILPLLDAPIADKFRKERGSLKFTCDNPSDSGPLTGRFENKGSEYEIVLDSVLPNLHFAEEVSGTFEVTDESLTITPDGLGLGPFKNDIDGIVISGGIVDVDQ